MLKLFDVTLIAIGSEAYADANNYAISQSCRGIEFGAVRNIVDKDCTTLDAYSHAMLYKLTDYVQTPYALTVQQDGMVQNPDMWDDSFFEYDYIGAPWPPKTHYTAEGEEVRVGNGGFSFRSKKLLDAFNVLQLPFTDGGKGFFNEDGQICNYHRKALEDYGIKFAPVSVAATFSHELPVPESVERTFGYHKYP